MFLVLHNSKSKVKVYLNKGVFHYNSPAIYLSAWVVRVEVDVMIQDDTF